MGVVAGGGYASSFAFILVLFVLLVIILKSIAY